MMCVQLSEFEFSLQGAFRGTQILASQSKLTTPQLSWGALLVFEQFIVYYMYLCLKAVNPNKCLSGLKLKKVSHQMHSIYLLNVLFSIVQLYGELFIGRLRSIKWWNYKAVRRNRLMQSWLTDLPAIQTGMLVVSAVTFHSTGSEVQPGPPTAAAAVKLCLLWELFFTIKATVIYCDLCKQKKWKLCH